MSSCHENPRSQDSASRVIIPGYCLCSDRVQNELNSLGQVNAKVDLKKQHAVVKLGREVSDDELKACVEKAGYTVKKID